MPEKSDGSIIIDTSIDLAGIDKAMKKMKDTVSSGANQSAEEFDAMQKAVEKTVEKLDNINAQIEVQQRLLDGLRGKYEQVSRIKGVDSPEALKLQKQILSAESAISSLIDKSDALSESIHNMDQKMEDAAKGVKNTGDTTKKAGDKIKKTGDDAKEAGKGVDEFGESTKKTAEKSRTLTTALGNLAADGIKKVVSAAQELLDSTREYRKDLESLEQAAADAGVSFETAKELLKDLMFVSDGDEDSSIEALVNLLNADFSEANLVTAVEQLSGLVSMFPNTIGIEALGESLQETLATGEATGQFAEALGRLGINVDDFEKGLAKAVKTGREQEYVLETLADKGLQDTYKQYLAANEGAKKYSDAQFDLNDKLANFAEKIEPIVTRGIEEVIDFLDENEDSINALLDTVVDFSNFLMDELLPTVQSGIDAFDFFTGNIDDAKKSTDGLSGKLKDLLGYIKNITDILSGKKAGELISKWLTGGATKTSTVSIPTNAPVGRGYATGTDYATRGWHPIAEHGAELILDPGVKLFKGGETVIPFNQTRALLGLSGMGNGTTIQNLTINPSASQWAQVMDLLRQAEVAGQMRRAR